MILVRVALALAAAAASVAGLLAATADKLPEATAPVPAVCVTLPLNTSGGVQAGICK